MLKRPLPGVGWSLDAAEKMAVALPADPRFSAGPGGAGIFNAPFALESYVQVFDEEGALDRFEAFASEHGPRFYGLPLNPGTVRFRPP